ncbi:MAG: PolC-type DNA polymerase III [Candidatus Fimimonas sp.]
MKERPHKGQSLFSFLKDYTVVDIETTGFNPNDSEILEISAIRVRNNVPVATFSSLIKPQKYVPYSITRLTGITNDMVRFAPPVHEVLHRFAVFLGNDVIVGYNVNFDVDFLYDNLLNVHGVLLTNSYVDVLRIARKLVKNVPNHKQTTVAAYFQICAEGAHRALRDCEICNLCYQKLREIWFSQNPV